MTDVESNIAVQPASHILPTDISEPEARLGITWASDADDGMCDIGRCTWPLDVMVWPVGTSALMVG